MPKERFSTPIYDTYQDTDEFGEPDEKVNSCDLSSDILSTKLEDLNQLGIT